MYGWCNCSAKYLFICTSLMYLPMKMYILIMILFFFTPVFSSKDGSTGSSPAGSVSETPKKSVRKSKKNTESRNKVYNSVLESVFGAVRSTRLKKLLSLFIMNVVHIGVSNVRWWWFEGFYDGHGSSRQCVVAMLWSCQCCAAHWFFTAANAKPAASVVLVAH